MTTISLSDNFLISTTLFGAVVTVGLVGMLTIDRIDRQLTFSTCAECSQGAGSGDDMAAILRE
jgi:hypothetical protein